MHQTRIFSDAWDSRIIDSTLGPRLLDGSGRVGFWKFWPDPLGFGSRRVRALGKPVPLGSGRVEPENPTELTGGDDEVELKFFYIL